MMRRVQGWSSWRNLHGEESVESYQNARRYLRYLYDRGGLRLKGKYRQLLVGRCRSLGLPRFCRSTHCNSSFSKTWGVNITNILIQGASGIGTISCNPRILQGTFGIIIRILEAAEVEVNSLRGMGFSVASFQPV